MNPPAAKPQSNGSTTPITCPAAIAASTAFPPVCIIIIAVSVAFLLAAAAAPIFKGPCSKLIGSRKFNIVLLDLIRS